MKLLTHNMLQSPGTRRGYPLAIEVEKEGRDGGDRPVREFLRLINKTMVCDWA